MASLASVQMFVLIAFLAATTLLAATWWMIRTQRASQRFQDLEVHSRGLVQPLRRVMPRFRHELARGRRYDRTLSAVVIGLRELAVKPATSGHGASSKDVAPVWALATGSLIQNSLRESDLVGWDVGMNRYVALLPETNQQQSRLAADRLVHLIREHMPVQVSVGISEFRTDGITVEDLLARAAERCEQGKIAITAMAAEPNALTVEADGIERSGNR